MQNRLKNLIKMRIKWKNILRIKRKNIFSTHFSNADASKKKEIKAIMSEYGFKKFSDDDIPIIALEKIVNILKQ